MSKNKHGLGRGFESLIPTDLLDDTFDITASEDKKLTSLKSILLSKVKADPSQPRRHFDKEGLEELALSIKEHGVLQPIVVVKSNNEYIIVAGERRYRASKLAGLSEIPALVRSLNSQNRLEVSLIENLQRRDLNAIETATAYQKLKDQFNLNIDQIGARVGNKSVSAVSNTMRLLRLPKQVQELIVTGELTEGQARPLIGLKQEDAIKISTAIIKESWSARRIESHIKGLKDKEKQFTSKGVEATSALQENYYKRAENLSTKLKTKVSVKSNAKGSGSLIIKFKDQSEFDRLVNLI